MYCTIPPYPVQQLHLYSMTMGNLKHLEHQHLEHLAADATVGDLPLHDICISHRTFGKAVSELFEQNPSLPGILIEDQNGSTSLLSKQRFYERLSSPYGLELFLKNPISSLLAMCRQNGQVMEMVVLHHSETIEAAVQQGLQRSPGNLYEPLIIIFEDDSLPGFSVQLVLDFQVLLLAQAQLLSQANARIKEEQEKARIYLNKYRHQQRKVQEYNKKLQAQQVVIQERNQVLEQQQSGLIAQAQEIQDLNYRFFKLGELLSSEGRKVFQATFAGVNTICRNADQILAAGSTLNQEVQTLEQISHSMAKVSRQVHYLSVKASIVVNQSKEVPSGFTTISEEMSHLLSGTFAASQQLTQVSEHLNQHIQNLTKAAQAGMNTARSLISQMREAQIAVNELEALVKQSQGSVSSPTNEDDRATLIEVPNPLQEPEAMLGNRLGQDSLNSLNESRCDPVQCREVS